MAKVVKRPHGDKPIFLSQGKVFLAAAWCDVNDAGPFHLADRLPGDDAVNGAGALVGPPVLLEDDLGDLSRIARGMALGRQLIERPVIRPADHLGAFELAQYLKAP